MIQELLDNNLPSKVCAYLEGRLKARSLGGLSHTYIFAIEDSLIGYSILDYDKEKIERGFFIYEIMIDPEKRNMGYGSEFLKEIINLAERLGFYRVMCKPCPIEDTIDKEDYRIKKEKLRKWYIKNRFKIFENEDYIYTILHPTTASTL